MANGSVAHDFELPQLLRNCKLKGFSCKDVLYREGSHAEGTYVIRKGIVKLLSYLPNGRSRIVRLHGASHWLGLEGVVRQPYEHTAIAVDDVEAYFVSMDNLRLIQRDNPGAFADILVQVYRNLTQADRWLAEFSTGGIKARVARLVDFLSKFEHGESATMVELLSVHEMADILGVSPESVSRALAEFKRSAILTRERADDPYRIDALKLREEAQQ